MLVSDLLLSKLFFFLICKLLKEKEKMKSGNMMAMAQKQIA